MALTAIEKQQLIDALTADIIRRLGNAPHVVEVVKQMIDLVLMSRTDQKATVDVILTRWEEFTSGRLARVATDATTSTTNLTREVADIASAKTAFGGLP